MSRPRPSPDLSGTPLADPASLPALDPATLGPTLVVAPHADDESLGCGGAIARLVDLGLAVSVAFVSDGSKSHPGSRSYPSDRLRDLREVEALAALEALGLDPGRARVAFFRLPDTAVPADGTDGFAEAVARASAFYRECRPQTLLLPWRRDPHCDHRSSRSIFLAASADLIPSPRVLEYPLWAYEAADPADLPRPDEVAALRLDVAEVLPRKRLAIAAHRSQTTSLIDDDPGGFRLSPAVLAHFDTPWEIYLEPLSP